MQNREYREKWAVSQSFIKLWRVNSPNQWKRKCIDNEPDDNDNNPAVLLGSLLDILLFTPERLEECFYISNENKLPSDSIKWIADSVYKDLLNKQQVQESLSSELPDMPNIDFSLEIHTDLILHYLDLCPMKDPKGVISYGWQTNWKKDTRINNFLENASSYYKILFESKGRQIITSELNMQAIELVDILKKNKWTSKYFIAEEDIELQFQVEIFAEHKTEFGIIPIKGALDIRRIDHKNKTIQIIDFKKAFSAHQFLENIRKYSYDSQLAYYIWLNNLNNDYTDYKMLYPINIVIDLIEKTPYIYKYSQRDLDLCKFGNKDLLESLYGKTHIFKIKKGFLEVLEEISWHLVSNNWEQHKEMYEKGYIELNLINN